MGFWGILCIPPRDTPPPVGTPRRAYFGTAPYLYITGVQVPAQNHVPAAVAPRTEKRALGALRFSPTVPPRRGLSPRCNPL